MTNCAQVGHLKWFHRFLFQFFCHQTIYVILSHYWLMFVLKCLKKQEYSMDATCEPMNNKYWTTAASSKDKNKVKDQLKRFHTTRKKDNVFRHSTIQQYRGSGREWSDGVSFIIIHNNNNILTFCNNTQSYTFVGWCDCTIFIFRFIYIASVKTGEHHVSNSK